jgi:membrane associated rhomboid family serine protease
MKMTIGKLSLFLAATAAVLFCTANPGLFICTRDGLASGEFWRLFTGHFVHFTRTHLLANLAALGMLLFLLRRVTGWQLLWLGLATPLLLGGLLYLARPELAAYGGLSGWISALFITIAATTHSETGHPSRTPGMISQLGRKAARMLRWEKQHPHHADPNHLLHHPQTLGAHHLPRHTWLSYLFRISIILFVAKIILEFSFGHSLVTHLGPAVMIEPAAHALGAAIALLGLFLDPKRSIEWSNEKPPGLPPHRNILPA